MIRTRTIAGAAAIARVTGALQVSEQLAEQMIIDAQARHDLDRMGVGLGLMNLDRFEHWLTGLSPKPVPNLLQKGRGGRPPKYDYEGMLIEAFRICFNEPMQDLTPESLVKRLEAWLIDRHDNGGPDRREIKTRVDRFWREVISREN